MVYEFIIEEKKRVIIPVVAENPSEAKKMFDEWYNSCQENDENIEQMLDDGYMGRTTCYREGVDETDYWQKHDKNGYLKIIPNEIFVPRPDIYSLWVYFQDEHKSISRDTINLWDISILLSELGKKYYLYPYHSEYGGGLATNKLMAVRAVLKDEKKIWDDERIKENEQV